MHTANLVLVVDDDFAMLRSTARLLRQFGYESWLFDSAEAFANHGQFDGVVCVLLDIDLGDGSGIELKHRLNAANVSVPVIYIAHDSRKAASARLICGLRCAGRSAPANPRWPARFSRA